MTERRSDLIAQLISLRKAKGLSQKDLSALCGMTQSVIARIESEKSTPTIATFEKIIGAMGATLIVSSEAGE